jgi:hypothetical protein
MLFVTEQMLRNNLEYLDTPEGQARPSDMLHQLRDNMRRDLVRNQGRQLLIIEDLRRLHGRDQ